MPNPTQHTSNFVSGSSGNTIAKAFTGAVTAGSTLAAVVMWSSTTATVTVSDSVNGSWTADATSLASGGSRRAQWFYFKSTASGTPTVTATVSGNVNERNLHIFEIPSINQTTPVDSSNGATGTSTTPTATPTVVASTQVTLLGAAYGGGTSSTGTGFTAGENTDGNQSEFKLSTGTGAQPVAFAMTPSQSWASSAIAFLDVSGVNLTAATGIASTGGTVGLQVTLGAAGGSGTATGGTVTTGSVTSLSATGGTAVATGGTAAPTFVYSLAGGGASASGPSVSTSITLDATAGTATATGGTVNFSAGTPLNLSATAGAGAGTAAGTAVTLTATYTATAGIGSAGGGNATASTSGGPLSAIGGDATAAGGLATLTFRLPAATGTATAGAGTATASKSYDLTAATGNAPAAGGALVVSYRWTATLGAGTAGGGAATATSFVPTLGHIDAGSALTGAID